MPNLTLRVVFGILVILAVAIWLSVWLDVDGDVGDF